MPSARRKVAFVTVPAELEVRAIRRKKSSNTVFLTAFTDVDVVVVNVGVAFTAVVVIAPVSDGNDKEEEDDEDGAEDDDDDDDGESEDVNEGKGKEEEEDEEERMDSVAGFSGGGNSVASEKRDECAGIRSSLMACQRHDALRKRATPLHATCCGCKGSLCCFVSAASTASVVDAIAFKPLVGDLAPRGGVLAAAERGCSQVM